MAEELNLFNPDTMQVDDELKKLSNRIKWKDYLTNPY